MMTTVPRRQDHHSPWEKHKPKQYGLMHLTLSTVCLPLLILTWHVCFFYVDSRSLDVGEILSSNV